jgi:DNA polymerase-3 subunit alpha
VRLWAPLGPEGQAEVILGRNFRIDEELLAQVAVLPGMRSAEFASTQAMLAAAA